MIVKIVAVVADLVSRDTQAAQVRNNIGGIIPRRNNAFKSDFAQLLFLDYRVFTVIAGAAHD